ncbi:MAG: 50S ribosomal protein L5 [Candidatus Anoxychlamydiales bacterium]|uniref:50S ribosomal protein L5 n=1 Tax=marine sediment metagenome TaxID=412755 RepID=A0A0F9LGB8_9ZZZZ|nr:50S ribosomal protein L5 [Candidatus Anoxychlamydiales bacterium]NGX40904.1 50S ribosomal protein L5 [Candidatus Anoxychlamydiales bacterium]HEU64636.1 50S ribosomal protein L5 [Chlamydiota bacterium]
MSRLKKKFLDEIVAAFLKDDAKLNRMQVPELKKIVISMGLKENERDKTSLELHTKELALLSGQKPIVTKAKKAISNFKLREGQVIGLKVTLRKKKMYDFFDRFCNIVCPRIRDFRGFNTKADGKGSYNIGLDDQQSFPEINLDEVKSQQGMNIAFVTTATTDVDCIKLLRKMGFPFK